MALCGTDAGTFDDNVNLLSIQSYCSLSILTAIFPGESGLDGFTGAKDDGGGGDNWS